MANDGLQVTIECAKEAFNYFMGKRSLSNNMDINFDMMIAAAEELQAKREDNERTVEENRTKATTRCYKTWLSSVAKTLEKVEGLQAEYDSERSTHLMRRSNFSGRVIAMRQEVRRLVEEGGFEGGFLVDKPPEKIVKLNAPELEGFPTLQRSLEQLLELLKVDKLKGIGIFGTVGVGKTTIMKNLNNHKEVAKLFDIVIWANASREINAEELQSGIAQRLKLKMEGPMCSGEQLASIISEEMKNKKYLLLLDEVTESIDLQQIGIPGNSNGSKVVLTTEFKHVCSSMADRMVKVDQLSSDEAWRMFQQIAADKIDLPDVEPIARLVVDECDGLPLVIRTVASSFKLKDSDSEWRNGLREFEKWPEIQIPGLKDMHKLLKFCYDELKDEKKKKCFLQGASYRPGIKIYTDYLVDCWVSEGLLDTNGSREFREKRDEGYDILGHLVKVSLLEKGERMLYVRMNNSVRQVALNILSQEPDCKFIVLKRGHSPSSQIWKDCQQAKRIAMTAGEGLALPESPNCEELLSLLLQRNSDLATIPPSFFQNMQKLLVLDLYQTGIASLPSSASKLGRLKALFLNQCPNLTRLSSEVGKLTLLEVLDIRGCKIIFIPSLIGKLENLKCLRMSYYHHGANYKVISRLLRLEELVIDVISYDCWRDIATGVIEEVASLENLTILRICFPRPKILKMLMEKKQLWRDPKQVISFWLFIGCESNNNPLILDCFEYKVNRYVRYIYHENDDSEVFHVLPRIDALELVGHNNIKFLSDFMNVDSLNRIRGCLIERCNKVTSIIEAGREGEIDILPILEQLHLTSLPCLKSIFEGPISGKSLSKLHTIVVKNCPVLTKIFSNRVIQQLSKLKKLVIESCFEIEILIEFPSLEILELVDLPKLRTISTDESLSWPHLKVLKIFGCPEVKSLPFSEDNGQLKLIEGERIWWEALQWPNSQVRDHLRSFCSLK